MAGKCFGTTNGQPVILSGIKSFIQFSFFTFSKNGSMIIAIMNITGKFKLAELFGKSLTLGINRKAESKQIRSG